MGSTHVYLRDEEPDEDPFAVPGFWMRDEMLELWLRLLALHVGDPDPNDEAKAALTRRIRDQWLLASRGCFGGLVPHGLPEAVATEAGGAIVHDAVMSLNRALEQVDRLPPEMLKLMGLRDWSFDGPRWRDGIDAERLRDIGRAFLDLLDGKIVGANHDCAFMPGEQAG